MRRIAWIGVAVVLATAGAVAWWTWPEEASEGAPATVEKRSPDRPGAESGNPPSTGGRGPQTAAPRVAEDEGSDSAQSDAEEPPQTDEERAEAAAEAKVEAFDNLTDKWMEPAKAGVSMQDVAAFVAAFRQVPKDRQDECIHRALNLVPDENVMLLAGVLMERGMDKDVVEAVFNDVLNRDEGVKQPILRQIFKDKSHPCWADTAWILDVTGEAPEATH